jgi:energy-coupling factor transporter transmembrane protein EcfT
MFHPLLLWSVPLVVFIMICLTYFSMFATSAPDIAYLIRALFTKKEAVGVALPHIILQFIFVADVVSATILLARQRVYEKEKKMATAPKETPKVPEKAD